MVNLIAVIINIKNASHPTHHTPTAEMAFIAGLAIFARCNLAGQFLFRQSCIYWCTRNEYLMYRIFCVNIIRNNISLIFFASNTLQLFIYL